MTNLNPQKLLLADYKNKIGIAKWERLCSLVNILEEKKIPYKLKTLLKCSRVELLRMKNKALKGELESIV